MVPFQNKPEFRQQKWYHFKNGLKFLNKNGTISEKVQILPTKMVSYSRTLLSPLKPRIIQPPYNPKIDKIRGFNRLAPLNPPKLPKLNPLLPFFIITGGLRGEGRGGPRSKPQKWYLLRSKIKPS